MALVRLRLRLDDEPGRLALVAAEIANQHGNILNLSVLHDIEGGVVDDLVVQLSHEIDVEILATRLRGAGCHDVSYRTVDAHLLVDTPTRMLDLASRLAEDPGTLPAVLADLLSADEVTVHDVDEPDTAPVADRTVGHAVGRTADRTTITLPLYDGCTAEVRRRWPAFTLTEEARGLALLRLAHALTGGVQPVTERRAWTVVLGDSEKIVIRTAQAEDLPSLEAMYQRYSQSNPHHRLGGYATEASSRLLPAVVTDDDTHIALIALDESGRLVGHGQLHRISTDTADVAMVVDEAYRGRGIGTALARRLVDIAGDQRIQQLRAWTQPDNWSFFCALLRATLALEVTHDNGRVLLQAPVPAKPQAELVVTKARTSPLAR
jgi:GNAT superfamily N-acetyltransferase